MSRYKLTALGLAAAAAFVTGGLYYEVYETIAGARRRFPWLVTGGRRLAGLPLESIMIFNARAEGYVQYGFKPNPLGFVTRTDAELELYEPHKKHRGRLEHVVRVGPGRLIGIGAGGLVARIGRTEIWLSGLPRATPYWIEIARSLGPVTN